MAWTRIGIVLLAVSLRAGAPLPLTPQAPAKPMLGDQSTGSRAPAVHAILLRDAEGDTIQPDDRRPLPFSPGRTCGADCHDVKRIEQGWHFNSISSGVPAGRNGQPWLFVDAETGTQIPLAYRPWPGTYRPQALGMSTWEFALRFGGRMAGGLSAAAELTPAKRMRWNASGDLELNCLVCHDGSPAYDHAEYARQVVLENFRYAAAAASGIAAVSGSSKEMPDFFDYLLPFSIEDGLQPKTPAVQYARNRFLPGDKIAFEISREVKSSRCYYCHTNADVEEIGTRRWKAGQDVHLARGLNCVQCHSNGLDHMMVRGYEGESDPAKEAFRASLSCKGCHMGTDGERPSARHFGAPRPKHAGIPPLHFDKLTCTACHSGPWPELETRRLKNGITHGLSEHGSNKSAGALPHIYYPVFARQADGKLAPYRVVWPAFWGRLRDESVQPLHPADVKRSLVAAKLLHAAETGGNWPDFDEARVTRALRQLENDTGEQHLVYIAGGKLHRLDHSAGLTVEDHIQAQPYLWPLAHDVRPASEALGAHGCEDCHSARAAFFFGNVTVDSPLREAAAWKMNRFENNLDVRYQVRLAETWVYRPWLKGVGVASAAVLLLVLSGSFLRALERLAIRLSGKH